MRRKGREEFRIRKFARRYDRLSGKFTFDIGYETRTDITDRTVAVAEAFGMGSASLSGMCSTIMCSWR